MGVNVFLEHVYGRDVFLEHCFCNTFMGVTACFWNTFMGVNVFLEHVYGRECVSGTRLWA